MSMRIGYCRVSTLEQDTALQEQALEAAGCGRVFRDQISSRAVSRPQLTAALDHLRRGDVLVVWRLDRVARSVRELIGLAEQLEAVGVELVSLTEALDTTTAAGKAMFQMIAVFAEFERNLIRERTRAGLATARAQGRRGGRKRRLDEAQLRAAQGMVDRGDTVAHVARVLGVPDSTLRDGLGRAGRVVGESRAVPSTSGSGVGE